MGRSTSILFFKPYGVLSQFTPVAGRLCLRDFGPFPPGVYAAGRLDADSEGLLLLTDDNELKHRLTTPRFGHPRTYLVQVENIPGEDALDRLRNGIMLDGARTRPAAVRLLPDEPRLPPRPVPIRFRRNIPTCWLETILQEGKNRQVRRMTAVVGHPTLRLVRSAIGFLQLGDLQPGDSRRLTAEEEESLRTSLSLPMRAGGLRRTGRLGGF